LKKRGGRTASLLALNGRRKKTGPSAWAFNRGRGEKREGLGKKVEHLLLSIALNPRKRKGRKRKG